MIFQHCKWSYGWEHSSWFYSVVVHMFLHYFVVFVDSCQHVKVALTVVVQVFFCLDQQKVSVDGHLCQENHHLPVHPLHLTQFVEMDSAEGKKNKLFNPFYSRFNLTKGFDCRQNPPQTIYLNLLRVWLKYKLVNCTNLILFYSYLN